jgi:hypothetical protein
MTLPNPTVRVFFGLAAAGDDFFMLDDPVKGLLNSTYRLAGDVGSELANAYAVSVTRGRSRWLDENEAGTCTVQFRNYDRTYDPLLEADVDLVDDDGDIPVDENGDLLTSPTSPYLGVLIPGKQVEVEIYGARIFTGRVEQWDVTYTVDRTANATMRAVDALGELARREFDEWTTTAGQTAGDRLVAVLNRSDVNFSAARDIADGLSPLQGDTVSWGSNVLNYLQLVTKSDLGNLYASRSGVLTFRDRHSRLSGPLAATFTDDPETGLPFVDARIESGSDLLFNRVGVDREGGTLQTVQDAASQNEVGIRSLSVTGLLLDSDTQSANMASYLLGLFANTRERVAAISLNLTAMSDEQRATVCHVELDDRIDISFVPLGIGDEVSQTLFVEGIEHGISADGTHFVTLSTSRSDAAAAFTLDDALLGLLDGAGVLTY